jgi:hypothetical protein
MGRFQDAVEKFESEHGRMTPDEIRQFGKKWKEREGKAPSSATAKVPEGSFKHAAMSTLASWLAPSHDETASATEDPRDIPVERPAGRTIGEWLTQARRHLMGSDTEMANRELETNRMIEKPLAKLDEVLTGTPSVEHLQGTPGHPIEMVEVPADEPEFSPGNPLHLDSDKIDSIVPRYAVEVGTPEIESRPEMRTGEVVVKVPKRRKPVDKE